MAKPKSSLSQNQIIIQNFMWQIGQNEQSCWSYKFARTENEVCRRLVVFTDQSGV